MGLFHICFVFPGVHHDTHLVVAHVPHVPHILGEPDCDLTSGSLYQLSQWGLPSDTSMSPARGGREQINSH